MIALPARSGAALVRPARPEDAAGVGRVHGAVFGTTYSGLLPPALIEEASGPERSARWAALAVDPCEGRLFVAEVDGAVAGFLYAGPVLDARLDAGREVRSLQVLGEHRGRGLGRALMVLGARDALDGGSPSLALWAVRGNAVAERFYDGLGAVRGAERTDWECGHAIPERAHRWPDARSLLRGRCP